MPSIYAHNKFGKKVLSSLNAECKAVVKKYPNQFRIGLQGPDYLFFYLPYIPNRVKQLGYDMHGRIATEFFENAVTIIKENGMNTGLFAYLLGFTCHFVLDSQCHSYITQAMQKTGIGHVELESEYDRHLMENDGNNPLKYKVWKLVPTDADTAKDIAKFYDGVTVKNVKSALKQMKIIKRILMPNPAKEIVINMLLHLTTHYVDLQGHMIKQKFNESCNISNEELDKLFQEAKYVAVELIENLIMCIKDEDELSERFNRNFK